MSRSVDQVHEFTQERTFGIDKEKTVVRCDDGAVYEFEDSESLPKDSPPRLVRAFQPDGSLTHVSGRKILPAAVEETAETLFGGWSK